MSEKTSNNSMKRPPVVVVVGHVDHGKTTLLDSIRKSNVASREAGGITQAISAYEIVHAGQKMTFIDTPGHESFAKMRARGARIADLAILVVAADEGVKEQTIEAISLLHSSQLPFVVAMTKIDKDGANVEKLKSDLATHEVYLEGFGGTVSYQPISAKTGEGMNELLDLLILAADVEGLSCDENSFGQGFVLEVRRTPARGLEVVGIVKNGTVHVGDVISAGGVFGKVKILEDFSGKTVKSLTPCAPALIVGFEAAPAIGDEFTCDSQVHEKTVAASKTVTSVAPTHAAPLTPASFVKPKNKDDVFSVSLKAGDAGSLEALSQIVRSLELPRGRVLEVVAESIGDITDRDVQFSISTGSVILGFKTKVNKAAKTLGENNHVEIATSDVVYDLIKAIEQLVVEAGKAQSAGELDVLAVFNQERLNKQLVGGAVIRGMFKNKGAVQVVREGKMIGQGTLLSLRQQKKEAVTVAAPNECGVLVDVSVRIEVGDRLLLL